MGPFWKSLKKKGFSFINKNKNRKSLEKKKKKQKQHVILHLDITIKEFFIIIKVFNFDILLV